MIITKLNTTSKLHFKFLEKFSAKNAGRKGLSLWLTPPKYNPSTYESNILQLAKIKRIPFKESIYQSSIDTYYTLYGWGEEGPVVLLVHGWGGSAAQMTPLVKPLVESGFQVLAFDALGHGDSPGKQTDINETIDIIKDMSSKIELDGIIAQSTGAIASVMAIADGITSKKLVVCGAAASVDYYLRTFSQKLQANRQTMGRISYYINTQLKRNIKDFSIINIVPSLKQSALIIHDKNDEVVEYTEAVALSKLWSMARLHLTENLGHFGAFTDMAMLKTMIDYLKF